MRQDYYCVLLKERNRRMAASTKREDILAATLRLTAEKGIQGITTADIAKAANVGMGTIYNYFESKDVLLTALFDQLKVKFIETIVSNYNFDNDPHQNFKNIVVVLVRYYVAHADEFGFLERYSDSRLQFGKGLDESTKLIGHVTSMLEDVKHDYKFKNFPPSVLLAMTYGPLVAIVNLVLMKQIELTDELLSEIADACWDSILDK